MKGTKKSDLPEKICPVCKLSFSWRKKLGKKLEKCYLL